MGSHSAGPPPAACWVANSAAGAAGGGSVVSGTRAPTACYLDISSFFSPQFASPDAARASQCPSPKRTLLMRLSTALFLLALAATARAVVTNEYSSREDYAAKNNVELAPTLVPATTPEFCKTGSAVFMPDTK